MSANDTSNGSASSKKVKLEREEENAIVDRIIDKRFGTVSVDRMVENIRAASHREVVELVYEHTIADLSLLPQKNGQSYLTPVFAARSHPCIEWNLKIFPKGEGNDDENHLSVFLNRVLRRDDSPVVALFKIDLIRNGKLILSRSCNPAQQYTLKTTSFGLLKLISLDQLKNGDSKGTELKIACHLICEVKRVNSVFSR